jgi:hypothetical protein
MVTNHLLDAYNLPKFEFDLLERDIISNCRLYLLMCFGDFFFFFLAFYLKNCYDKGI